MGIVLRRQCWRLDAAAETNRAMHGKSACATFYSAKSTFDETKDYWRAARMMTDCQSGDFAADGDVILTHI